MSRPNGLLGSLSFDLVFASIIFCCFCAHGTEPAIEKIRDPFWPVGYVPEEWGSSTVENNDDPVIEDRVPKTVDVGWDEALGQVRVEGVSSKGDATVVIINGHVTKIGGTLSVEYAGDRYTWLIESLDKTGALKLRRISVQRR